MTIQEMNQKTEALLGELTLEEKIRMIHGDGLFQSGDVKRLGIPALRMSDGPMGVRHEFHNDDWIPVGNSDDFVSYLPSNSAVAATWNRELARGSGRVLGEEARGRGKDVILAPGINIKRVPVCGRNFEYMSEDPYLNAQMTVPMIRGIQESDVAACVKHFAVNSQETERVWVNVEIDERALREIYLPGFEAAVKEGGTYALMGGYNLLRGTHCCENQMLLDQILRREWGFDGAVITDWGALHDTKAAAEASVDLEMSVTDDFDDYYLANPLLRAVREGRISEEAVNRKVRNLIRLMLRLKMIDVAGKLAVPCPDRKSGCYNTPEHRRAALETARESIVLLKNEEGRLPLRPERLKKLLVIGDNAERLHAAGGGSAEIKALYEISPLLALKSRLGGNCQVTFARGYYVVPKEIRADVSWQKSSIDDEKADDSFMEARGMADEEIREKQRLLREEAAALAKEADEVLIIGGLNHDYDVEGYDREDLTLPYAQDELIGAVLDVRPDAVVVIRAGSPVSMGRWKDRAKAIVWDWYAGMEGGSALSEVLLGEVNPSGKLPESLPYRLEDCPAVALGEYPGRALTEEERQRMNARLTENYGEGLLVGYRYYEKQKIPVQFCFGHGLSYTSFAYAGLKITKTGNQRSPVQVSLTVKNTGSREGMETLQVYVGRQKPGSAEPVKALWGFQKISLLPGEKLPVELALSERAFQSWHTDAGAFVTDEGIYEIYAGSSLEDIRLKGEVMIKE